MAYIKPAVLVYQDLVSAGGAALSSPDMPACIVGPLTTVINVDLADPISKIESIGSINTGTTEIPVWEDATFAVTPDTGTPAEIFVNNASAKAGQILDLSTLVLTAENPLVKTFSFVAAGSTAGDPILVATNTVGDTEAVSSTALPFFVTVNHITLGDTAVISGSQDVVTYISEIDYTANTITLNNGPTIIAADVVTIYHKFDSLVVRSHDTPAAEGNIGYSTTLPLEADSVTTGYTMFPEVEIESAGDSFSVYIAYQADRADLSGRVLTINDTTDLVDQLGEVNSSNPLAYGVSLALANSGGTSVHAIALDPSISESLGHTQATELAQAQRIHQLVPLTQQLSIHATYLTHASAMSTPESGNWRAAMTNCAIPTEDYLYGQPGSSDGSDDDIYPDLLKSGTLAGADVTLSRGESAPLVFPGDYIVAAVEGTDAYGETIFTYTYSDDITSISGSNVVLDSADWFNEDGSAGTAPPADGVTGFIYFYIARPATKQGQAEWVASQAETWSSNRMWMFPGDVLIPNENGLDEELPGYYLMAGLAGFISGTPAQQPITSIAIAGISDLLHGNFYFTEAQMNIMAEKGTLLYAQNAQGTTPFCRHGLTTDVSILEYREILKVKNWDFLSYYYKDILDPFIGTWNITPDTIQTIRQTVISASEALLIRKLPKIGAPLLSYDITTLEQSTTSADAIDLIMGVAIVNPNNYTNVHLQL